MNYPTTEKKTVTPKKVFTSTESKAGVPFKDGAKLVALMVHNTQDPDNDVRISGFCRPTDHIPLEGVEVTLDVYENDYGWQFIPDKAPVQPTNTELMAKLDLILSYVTGTAPEPKKSVMSGNGPAGSSAQAMSQKDQEIIDNL